MIQEPSDSRQTAIEFSKLAFPHHDRLPSQRFKALDRLRIAAFRSTNLVQPEFCPCFWNIKEIAVVPVPETAVYKDH